MSHKNFLDQIDMAASDFKHLRITLIEYADRLRDIATRYPEECRPLSKEDDARYLEELNRSGYIDDSQMQIALRRL